MKNTKFRRRALISSVAMLLVALVALGSATFAWYEANMTVTATGMSFSTNAASGLEIISASDAAGSGSTASSVNGTTLNAATFKTDTTSFNQTLTNMQPASIDSNGDVYYTTAQGPAAAQYEPATGASVVKVTAAGERYIEEEVYFKIGAGTTTTGTVSLTNVAFTSTATAMAGAVRIAIYKPKFTTGETPTRDGWEFVGQYSSSTTDVTNHKCLTFGSGQTSPVAFAAATNESTTTLLASGSGTASQTICAVTQNKSVDQACLVRVYLDGYDSSVYTNQATEIGAVPTNILSGITLSFTLS